MLLLMIKTLGNHEWRVCYDFVLFLKFWWKMGQMMIFVRRMFWGKFYMELSVFSCLEMFKQTLGSNLSFGKSKLGFWGEKVSFSRNRTVPTRHSEWEASWRRAGGAFGELTRLASRFTRHGELHSGSIPCFAFLCLFPSFLFWIGFRCKHESCREFC